MNDQLDHEREKKTEAALPENAGMDTREMLGASDFIFIFPLINESPRSDSGRRWIQETFNRREVNSDKDHQAKGLFIFPARNKM